MYILRAFLHIVRYNICDVLEGKKEVRVGGIKRKEEEKKIMKKVSKDIQNKDN